MGLRFCVFVVVAMLAACQRTQSAPPAPAPSVTPVPAVAVAPSSPVASVGTPAPGESPDAEDADDDDDDIDKPWGPEFEITADASWYFGFVSREVQFGAKALNGTPPYTYTWEFDDGTPQATGDHTEHRYEKAGHYSPYVVGKDGKGETYRVTFYIVVVTREDYIQKKGPDAPLLQSPAPSPAP